MYLSAKQVKDRYQITNQTLYNWRRLNKIVYHKLPSGKIMYESLEVQPQQCKKNVLYARVSNTKQKNDLEHQKQLLRQYMVSNGIMVDDEYCDIASGMNENRKEFNQLMTSCIKGEIQKIFIISKDRLTRFSFGYIEHMLKQFGVEIVVVNATKEEDFQTELTQDLVSVIHHFSMKLYSNRRKTLKDLASEIQKDINI